MNSNNTEPIDLCDMTIVHTLICLSGTKSSWYPQTLSTEASYCRSFPASNVISRTIRYGIMQLAV